MDTRELLYQREMALQRKEMVVRNEQVEMNTHTLYKMINKDP